VSRDGGPDSQPATFVAATMDLQMGELLKHQRSSQIFSVCGVPDGCGRESSKNMKPQMHADARR
jgi:hypothetical protein